MTTTVVPMALLAPFQAIGPGLSFFKNPIMAFQILLKNFDHLF